MPVYEFLCKACSHTWETFQKITDEPITNCEKCNEPQAKRLISGGTAFSLKEGGSCGWGKNGYSSSK